MMRLPARLWAAGIIATMCLAAMASALPPAGAYPSREIALQKPSSDEDAALASIQRIRAQAGLAPLTWNASMSAVAREHSLDMAANGYCDYYSPTLGTLDYRLHRAGVSAANARFAVFQAADLTTLEESLRQGGFALHEASQAGIGISSTGLAQKRYFVTLMTRQAHTTLDPFPTMPLIGKSYRLSGSIAPRLSDLAIVITLPNGKVIESPLTVDAARRFLTTVQFNSGTGLYVVELTASGKLGPMVLDLLHCYAGNGKDYPPPDPADRPVSVPSDLRQAERMMLEMINRSRAEFALPPLKFDSRLADVARGHSDDMRLHNFFAHISPTRGDLGARLARAGIKARRFTENIAVNQDLAAAHRSLMDSPGHRKNILDADAGRVGIGIVAGDAKSLYVTENFLQEFASYDPAALASDLIKQVNAERAKARLPAFKSSDALRRIAALNNDWMARQGKPGYDKARSELDKGDLNMRSFQMAVAQSTDPPATELLGDELKKDFQFIGVAVTQTTAPDGERILYTTVLLGGN